MLSVDQSPPNHIHDGSRGADKDMGIVLLASLCRIGDGSHGNQTFHKLSHMRDDTENLARQLTARGEHKRLGRQYAQVDAGEDVEGESSGLARAGLGLRNHVHRGIKEKQRQGLFLDLGRL